MQRQNLSHQSLTHSMLKVFWTFHWNPSTAHQESQATDNQRIKLLFFHPSHYARAYFLREHGTTWCRERGTACHHDETPICRHHRQSEQFEKQHRGLRDQKTFSGCNHSSWTGLYGSSQSNHNSPQLISIFSPFLIWLQVDQHRQNKSMFSKVSVGFSHSS